MGLDDFKTSSSSSTASQAGSTSSSGSQSSSTSNTVNSNPDEITPWFTAVIEKEDDEMGEVETEVKVFMKKQAFHRGGRHLNEKFLACIETEDDFNRINDVCRELHDCTLEEFFYRDPIRAADFTDRLGGKGPKSTEAECAVCGELILIKEDDYTKIDGDLVHANHNVDEVVEELEIRV